MHAAASGTGPTRIPPPPPLPRLPPFSYITRWWALISRQQGVLRGDPATVQELRTKVLDDLEEVREEIAELIEVEVGEE